MVSASRMERDLPNQLNPQISQIYADTTARLGKTKDEVSLSSALSGRAFGDQSRPGAEYACDAQEGGPLSVVAPRRGCAKRARFPDWGPLITQMGADSEAQVTDEGKHPSGVSTRLQSDCKSLFESRHQTPYLRPSVEDLELSRKALSAVLFVVTSGRAGCSAPLWRMIRINHLPRRRARRADYDHVQCRHEHQDATHGIVDMPSRLGPVDSPVVIPR